MYDFGLFRVRTPLVKLTDWLRIFLTCLILFRPEIRSQVVCGESRDSHYWDTAVDVYVLEYFRILHL